MDSAKAAVKDFMSKAGHHDTTVHEKVAPAVTHETINRTQHEDVQTAIDKEVHQDHYHTSVQPVEHAEQLKEQHHHNIIPVEHRSFEHDNSEDVQRRLGAEQAKFRDTSERVEGQHTSSVAPIVAGEHVHHHVHETIQPVVNKQTIEPHVVHTTVPIHEVHHNSAQHHATSALPAVSMADFKKQGGVLTGREERYDGFEGEPRSVGGALGSQVGGNEYGSTGRTGTGSGLERGLERGLEHERERGVGSSGTDSYGSNTGSTTHKKPGLMDKLNPKKDTDGDGKAGLMD